MLTVRTRKFRPYAAKRRAASATNRQHCDFLPLSFGVRPTGRRGDALCLRRVMCRGEEGAGEDVANQNENATLITLF
ncbi:MAG: hypothetical protein A2Y66_08835 [Nitrospirae bacterium RBG_13_41_22]|nr:MAG: hypothetical protein A2Y66_08835 [Nitrospirae bacterium RBG_13_41_22]